MSLLQSAFHECIDGLPATHRRHEEYFLNCSVVQVSHQEPKYQTPIVTLFITQTYSVSLCLDLSAGTVYLHLFTNQPCRLDNSAVNWTMETSLFWVLAIVTML